MVLTLTKVRNTIVGNMRAAIYTADFDSSYPTGGEALTAANLGLRNIEFLQAESKGGIIFEYDHTNAKLKAFFNDFDAGANAGLIEVDNATNLSTTTGVRIIAFGG